MAEKRKSDDESSKPNHSKKNKSSSSIIYHEHDKNHIIIENAVFEGNRNFARYSFTLTTHIAYTHISFANKIMIQTNMPNDNEILIHPFGYMLPKIINFDIFKQFVENLKNGVSCSLDSDPRILYDSNAKSYGYSHCNATIFVCVGEECIKNIAEIFKRHVIDKINHYQSV